MPRNIIKKKHSIERTSYLWRRILIENRLPADGTVVEVAPGYEQKIGAALSLFGFRGTLYVIEPDPNAALHIHAVYRHILPKATIHIVCKPMEEVVPKDDILSPIEALVASHPFDDMVIASIVKEKNFFSEEKDAGTRISSAMRRMYAAIRDEKYATGICATAITWQRFIEEVRPRCVIASQYPSRTLTLKGLKKRQNSGYAVMENLKNTYKNSLIEHDHKRSFGVKGDPRWWLVAEFQEHPYY